MFLRLPFAAIFTVLPLAAQTASSPPTPRPQITEQVTVTTDRGLIGVNDSASSVATLTSAQLQQSPGLTLDDRLHQVAGFFLFRRTSSWTANPTSQGLSLRGLGSTAASRTLVVSDQVPLTDPFLGSVHWSEIPILAIGQVQLVRGGSADLYGSSAIGGVVEISPSTSQPTSKAGCLNLAGGSASTKPDAHCRKPASFQLDQLQLDAFGASENTAQGDAALRASSRRVGALAALSVLSTGGYIPTAPASRGFVDTVSNVAGESARTELRTVFNQHNNAFLRGNVLNEARANGTPLQTNGLRVWRYVAGDDVDSERTHAALRLYGSREAYRQSLSSIAADRNSERLTRLQSVPVDELGFVLQASRSFPRQVTAAVGLDTRDVRATDNELATATSVNTSTTARQRETGGYADAIWQPGVNGRTWSLSASIRVDSFRTFDAQSILSTSAAIARLPTLSELIASPRLGLVRQLPHGLALTATAFRAFRGPTLNELYRTGQVGSQTTLANNSLLAERATGFEFGGEYTHASLGHLRATYFWIEVNRPVSAVLLSQTVTTQTLQRQNLGQIRSRGLMLEAQSERRHNFDASLSWQLAVATVTAFNSTSPAQRNLTGNLIPQVPREAVTATANYTQPRVANLHFIASYTSAQFDDAENQFLLHPYARFDLSADRALSHGFSLFAATQNLLNRTIEAGRTPNLTLAAPRLVQAGLRYALTR